MTEKQYFFPEEGQEHEGTWLQWPHHYQYGKLFRNDLDPTWVAMTKALVTSIKNNRLEIDDYLKTAGIATLKTNAIELIQKGITSVEEVYPLLIE